MNKRRGEMLLHPIPLAALATLALNDHVAKQAWPGPVTGKVSDFAGMIIFPVLLMALYERRPGTGVASTQVVILSVALTAIAFASLQIAPAARAPYEITMGLLRWPVDAIWALSSGAAIEGPTRVQAWPDATDLLALPALSVPLYLGMRRSRQATVESKSPASKTKTTEVASSHR